MSDQAAERVVKRGLPSCAHTYIYLQTCGDCSDDCKKCPHQWPHNDDVTWCGDKINDSDVEYIQLEIAIAAIKAAIRKPAGAVPDDVVELLRQNGESF